jgi:peptidyl-prolyl cis-trans isomerase C
MLAAATAAAQGPAASSAKAPVADKASSAEARLAEELRRPFVSVDGQAQTRAMAEVALRERLARGAANTPQTLASVRDGLIDQALMARAGTRAGLDKDPLVEAQVELLRQRLLGQAWQRKVINDLKPTDKELKAEWARLNEERGKREVRIRHLLVREEPTAKLLVDRVQSGTPIAQLAAEYSVDEGTKGAGGLAAWAPEGLLIPGLSEAVKALKKGQLAAAPVQTSAGWHVVQLEDARNLEPTDFEEVKPQLVQRLGAKAVQTQLGKLREAAKVQ